MALGFCTDACHLVRHEDKPLPGETQPSMGDPGTRLCLLREHFGAGGTPAVRAQGGRFTFLSLLK